MASAAELRRAATERRAADRPYQSNCWYEVQNGESVVTFDWLEDAVEYNGGLEGVLEVHIQKGLSAMRFPVQ